VEPTTPGVSAGVDGEGAWNFMFSLDSGIGGDVASRGRSRRRGRPASTSLSSASEPVSRMVEPERTVEEIEARFLRVREGPVSVVVRCRGVRCGVRRLEATEYSLSLLAGLAGGMDSEDMALSS
jgi:hypothetical protein